MTVPFASDFRHGLRRLGARPWWFALAAGVLGVGLAATLYVVSMMHGLVFSPTPLLDTERSEQIGLADPANPDEIDAMPLADARALLPAMSGFEQVGLAARGTVNLAADATVARHAGAFVNAELFALLTVRPMLGRAIEPADEAAGAVAAVVIGHGLWRDRFGADPTVIGREVRVNARAARIVGVMPEDFTFPQLEEIWVALPVADTSAAVQSREVEMFALRRVGVSREQAVAPLAAAWSRQIAAKPASERNALLRTLPAREYFVSRQTMNIFGALMVTAFGVLLLACANVANLQIAGVVRRAPELALRAALGAGRARILASVLAECLVLVLVALLLALPLAQWAVGWTVRTLVETGEGPAPWMQFGVSPGLLAACAALALVAVLAAGLAPAWRASALGRADSLREGGRGTRSGGGRIGRVLVVGQVALSCVLLVAAGVMVQGLQAAARVDTGVRVPPAELLTGRIAVFPEQFPTAAERIAFYERVLARLRAHPDVVAASLSESLPASNASSARLQVDGIAAAAEASTVWRSAVDTAFLSTIGLAPLHGRGFDARDGADAQPVAVVDARFAERWWPGQDALGRRIRLDPEDPAAPWRTVVGVVPTMQLDELDDTPRPSVLLPLAQDAPAFMSLLVRVRGDAQAFAPTLAALVREVDANTPVYWVLRFDRVLAAAVAGQRILAWIYGLFGASGLLLAAAGLYGVLAQWVEARTREFGVRRAVGASGVRIVRQVAGNAAWLVGIGLAIGAALALPWAAAMMADIGYAGQDIGGVLFAVLAIIAACAVLAVLVPTRRALGIAPSEALRSE